MSRGRPLGPAGRSACAKMLCHAAARLPGIVPAKRFQLVAERGLRQRVEQPLHGAEFQVLLAKHHIIPLAGERHKVEAKRARGGTGGHAAIGQARVDAPRRRQVAGGTVGVAGDGAC